MNLRSFSRRGLVTLAAVGLATTFATATPASASETGVATPGTALGGAVAGVAVGGLGHVLGYNATYTGQLLGVNSVLIEYACTADASPDAAATGVDCSVNGQDTLGWVTLPGAASAAAGTAVVSISALVSGIHLCVHAHADYVESKIGPSSLSGGKCS